MYSGYQYLCFYALLIGHLIPDEYAMYVLNQSVRSGFYGFRYYGDVFQHVYRWSNHSHEAKR
jgi:hypothetical protein